MMTLRWAGSMPRKASEAMMADGGRPPRCVPPTTIRQPNTDRATGNGSRRARFLTGLVRSKPQGVPNCGHPRLGRDQPGFDVAVCHACVMALAWASSLA
jgi:hypothetical protein